MSGWDGNGNFTVTYDWTDQRDAGVKIRADQFDTQFNDVVSGLNNVLTKDGQNAATGNLPMGNNRHTNIANATARDQYSAAGQVQDGGLTYAAATGAADAYVATFTPALTSYSNGMLVWVLIGAGHTNTGASTVNWNSLGLKNVKRTDGSDPIAGDIKESTLHAFSYDGTSAILLNPATSAALSAFGASLIDDADAAAARTTLGLGDLATQSDSDAITLSGVVTFSEGTTNITKDGGPVTVNVGRNDAHGDAATLGDIVGFGRDDGDTATAFGRIRFTAVQDEDGNEDGSVIVRTMNAGSEELEVTLDDGVVVGGATGGAPGRGAVNAIGFQINGAACGGMVQLETNTASSSPNLSFETASAFDGTFSKLVFELEDIAPATNGAHLHVRLKQASAYLSGASDYMYATGGFVASTNVSNTANASSHIALSGGGSGLGTVAGEDLSGRIEVWRPAASGVNKFLLGDVFYADDDGSRATVRTVGGRLIANTNAINGVQFLMSSGNIASGSIRMYGVI